MKTMLAALLTAGMTVSGLAMAATPHQDIRQAAPTMAGASAAGTASTGGISAGQVVAVSLVVVATVGLVAGVARNDHNAITGTTGTH